MSVNSITNTDKLNYLNIGLILLSCAVAFFVPFELFLFSYAVLGPLHYLTEISWLHQRNYFSNGKRDYIFLGLAGVILFLLIYVVPKLHLHRDEPLIDPLTNQHMTTGIVYIAFLAAFAMVLLKKPFHRFLAFLVICSSAFISKEAVLLFSVFLPTLIHVFIFTLLFMLYGALKGRSKSGYLSCIVLVLCPLLFIFFNPTGGPLSNYATNSYGLFDTVNKSLLQLFNPELFQQKFLSADYYYKYNDLIVYSSPPGLIVMRFIAFAYTYHYLNWFSKTTVIKWHNVPKKRLVAIGALWIASVAFYLWNYEIGFHVLFLLSFLHVFLEFPLNHLTFIGIYQETKAILKGKPVAAPKSKQVK
jgi:hypothetical protein